MAEGSSTTPKAHFAIPEGYWDLPEDERLAEAGRLATAVQAALAPSSSSST